MSRSFFYIVVIVFSLLFFLDAKAQDSTTTVEVSPPIETVDSVYETSPSTTYHFKEVTAVNKVDARTIPSNDLKKVKSDEDYWYVNLAPPREKKKEAPENKNPISDKGWVKTLFWVLLIGAFIALLIWFLTTGNINLFRRGPKASSIESEEEIETDNIFEINFEKEIQKAIDAANYRLAVRLMYLRTLKDLSLQNLINYTHEKTNSDYLFQLAGSSYYKNFFRLTRDFDYTWYGHFPLSQESFSIIQNDFNNFKKQLS